MKKKTAKYIKEISERLPPVYEQTVSGFYEDYNDEGDIVRYPNVVVHEINHERRIRKAYERLGMEGVLHYLEMIHKLQKQRNDNHKNQLPNESDARVDDLVEEDNDKPVSDTAVNTDTLQAKDKKLGRNRKGNKGDGGNTGQSSK
jgi:hypothetical protein